MALRLTESALRRIVREEISEMGGIETMTDISDAEGVCAQVGSRWCRIVPSPTPGFDFGVSLTVPPGAGRGWYNRWIPGPGQGLALALEELGYEVQVTTRPSLTTTKTGPLRFVLACRR